MRENIRIHFTGGDSIVVHYDDWRLVEDKINKNGAKMFQSFRYKNPKDTILDYDSFRFSFNINNITHISKTGDDIYYYD